MHLDVHLQDLLPPRGWLSRRYEKFNVGLTWQDFLTLYQNVLMSQFTPVRAELTVRAAGMGKPSTPSELALRILLPKVSSCLAFSVAGLWNSDCVALGANKKKNTTEDRVLPCSPPAGELSGGC